MTSVTHYHVINRYLYFDLEFYDHVRKSANIEQHFEQQSAGVDKQPNDFCDTYGKVCC